jgi:hypothetical protein
MIVGWTEEHDTLILLSKSPDVLAKIKSQIRSDIKETENKFFPGGQKLFQQIDISKKQLLVSDIIETDWKSAK